MICGQLDIFNNPFCVEQNETCPINDIDFIYNDRLRKIEEIKIKRGQKNFPTIKRLIVSEKSSASIYDMNKIITYRNRFNETPEKIDYENYYKMEHYKNYSDNKSFFFEENNLIKGYAPNWFTNESIYLYHLDYFGNDIDYPIHKYHINIYQKPVRISIRVLIFLFKIYFIFICYKTDDQNIPIKNIIINMIVVVIYLAFVITNIILGEAKYHLTVNLNKYYLKMDFRVNGTGKFTFFVDICQMIFELLIFLGLLFLFGSLFKNHNSSINRLNEKLGKSF